MSFTATIHMINDPVPLRLHWITGMFTFTETEVRKKCKFVVLFFNSLLAG